MSNSLPTNQTLFDESKLVEIASKIQQQKGTVRKGRWLSEELSIGLQKLEPLLIQGGLEFKMVPGHRPSVVIHSSRDGRENTWNDIEAYSIKMMASRLKSSANQMLSRTLPEAHRNARLDLIDALHTLFVLLNDPADLEKKIVHHKKNSNELDQDEIRLREMKEELQRRRQKEVEQKRKEKEETLALEQKDRLAVIAKKRQEERVGDQVLEAVLCVKQVEHYFKEQENDFWEVFNDVMGAVHAGILDKEEAPPKIIKQIGAQSQTTG